MGDKTSQKQQKARSLLVATADIRAAENACQLLLERIKGKDDPLHIPLLTAIIISYSRPFRKNKGYMALEGKLGQFENREFQEIHDAILEMRDKVIAHSDSDVRMVEFETKDTPIGRRISEIRVVSQSLPMDIFPKLLETCRDLGNRLELEALEEMDCLLDHEN